MIPMRATIAIEVKDHKNSQKLVVQRNVQTPELEVKLVKFAYSIENRIFHSVLNCIL